MKKLNYEAAPLVMAFVLGPLMELNLRRSLILSDGSFQIFLNRPISAGFLLITAIIILISLGPLIRLKSRKTGLSEISK
jgi:putative tricarboxylic transport membrane protein